MNSGPKLVIIGGNSRGEEFPLHGGENAIGRGLDNDIVLADIAVSRKHTIIQNNGARFVLCDLGSGNGTLVNGKRVKRCALRHGDQVELGNTLFRYVDTDSTGGEEVSTEHLDIVHEEATALNPIADAEATSQEAITTDFEKPLAPPIKTEARKKRPRRALGFALFGALAVAFVLMGFVGFRIYSDREKQRIESQRQGHDVELATQHFELGRKFLLERDWQKARAEFVKVYALAPDFEHAKRYVNQAEKELAVKTAMDAAARALKERQYELAREQLAKVSGTSVYAGEAAQLKQRVDQQQVDALIDLAKKRNDSGDVVGALDVVTQALKVAPSREELLGLRDTLKQNGAASEQQATAEISAQKRVQPAVAMRAAPQRRDHGDRSSARPRGTRSRQRSRTPQKASMARPTSPQIAASRVSGGRAVRHAMTVYQRGAWKEAQTLMSAYGDSGNSASHKAAQAKAKKIQALATSLSMANTLQTRNPATAIKHLQKAIKLDGEIGGGRHRSRFSEQLYTIARMQAIASVGVGRLEAAHRFIVLAKRHGAADIRLAKAEAELEKKAMALFTRGYIVRRQNPTEARQLWQRVLHIVSPSSPAYQKAYTWLNRSAPNYVDEDED